jgi:hypothetical protein
MPTITANPVGCPTCTATIGEPCTTRSGAEAARPHKARLDAQIPLGRHTEDCRAAAATSAAENIAEWDTATRAEYGTNPIYWADRWLDDGTCECLCWTARRTPMISDRIRAGWAIITTTPDQATSYQSYSVRFVDADGNRLPGSPLCEYQAHDPRTAATLAAEGRLPGNPIVTVTGTDDGHNGGTWTFTPSTGSPVRVHATPAAEPTLIAHGPERRPAPEPGITRVTRRMDGASGTFREVTPDGWIVDMDHGTDVLGVATAWVVEPLTVDEAAYVADDAMFGPQDAEPEWAPAVVEYVTIERSNPNWAPVFAMADALAAEPEPASEIRTCAACEEPIEFYEGTGWVEVAPDGHYDLCPERYIEATDTQRGHVVAPKPSPAAVEPATFICRCGDEEHPVVPGDDDSVWCPCGLRLDEQRERIADEAHDFETEGRQDERAVTVCAVCGLYRSAAVHG